MRHHNEKGGKAMEQASVAMKVAKELAVYFLKHPKIKNVYLVGSTAMFGYGNDVDLILELSDKDLAFKFLKDLREFFESQDVYKDAEDIDEVEDLYGTLSSYRFPLALEILGLNDEFVKIIEICWDGHWEKWNELCHKKEYLQAARTEENHFRFADIFLMPENWQKDWDVWRILPWWPSKRVWGFVHFYRILTWQARRFNEETGSFEKSPLIYPWQERLIYEILKWRAEQAWEKKDVSGSIPEIGSDV